MKTAEHLNLRSPILQGNPDSSYASIVARYSDAHVRSAQFPPLNYQLSNKIWVVRSENGVVLNDFLPSGFSILNYPGRFYVSGTVISLDLKRMVEFGEEGAAIVSHEFGHALDPRYREYRLLEDAFLAENLDVERTPEQKLLARCNEVNTRWEKEINAWAYGKVVASALGVDELRYEDLMNLCFESYFQNELGGLAYEMRVRKVPSGLTLPIYDPSQQVVIDISAGELQKFCSDYTRVLVQVPQAR